VPAPADDECVSFAHGRPRIIRIPLSPDSWALAATVTQAAEPGAQQLLERRIRDLVSESRPDPPDKVQQGLTIIRVPGLDPLLGPALLHHDPATRATVYCAASQISASAAAALQALLASVGPRHTGALRHVHAPLAVPQLSVEPVPHDQLRARNRHPAALSVGVGQRERQATAQVCADMITIRLADVLGALWSAYAGALRGAPPAAAPPAGALGRPGESPAPVSVPACRAWRVRPRAAPGGSGPGTPRLRSPRPAPMSAPRPGLAVFCPRPAAKDPRLLIGSPAIAATRAAMSPPPARRTVRTRSTAVVRWTR
jgi:hypothetical protein